MKNWIQRKDEVKLACISTAQVPSTRANSIQVMKVCQALVQNGDEVTLYIPGEVPPGWQDLAGLYGLTAPFRIVMLKSRPFMRRMDFSLGALRLARRWGAELVYTRMLWVALLAGLRGVPVVLELHDLPTGNFGPIIYKYVLRSRSLKLVVYITSALKQLADERFGVKAREGEYIIAPDGVDLERYQSLPDPAAARKQQGLEEALTAVYSGGFYPGRGLELMQQLALSFPQVHFLWLGGTEEQVSNWRARLQDAGVNNVRLTGFIPNSQLPLYQAAADILLMPYSRSFSGSGGGDIGAVSSPMKLFEYMAASRCILASDLPVLREVLDERHAAFYQPEDFSDLCEKFAELLSDKARREKLAAAAREAVGAYDWKTRMGGIMRVIKTSINNN